MQGGEYQRKCLQKESTSTRYIVAHVREPKQAFAQRRVPETEIHIGEDLRLHRGEDREGS
jgi:hypothetical protein